MNDKKTNDIPIEHDYASFYVDVFGSKMHYIDEGEGDPIVFIHGIPTSSYLWRNIIPALSDKARCIAPDLIGMGQSDKPDIEYRIFDHIRYIDEFIKQLGLKNITFVLHAWGSIIGFDYAMRHEDNIKGLAFIESHIRPPKDWSMVSLPVHELSQVLDCPDEGYDVIINSNYFVNKVLPAGVLRDLSDEELEIYRAPFADPESRKLLWQYLKDLPLGDGPVDVVKLIDDYSAKLQASLIPKLMMYAIPGFITTMSSVQWARANLPNLTLVEIGEALHYAQESNPEVIRYVLRRWYVEVLEAGLEHSDAIVVVD